MLVENNRKRAALCNGVKKMWKSDVLYNRPDYNFHVGVER